MKIAVDLVNEGMITTDEAILKVEPKLSTPCCTRSLTPSR